MARRRGRKKIAEPENHERWLITYSDLITLLMIFFVIMYAMSKIDVAKFETLQESLSAALHQQDQIPLKNLGTTGLVVPSNPSDQGDKTKQNVSSVQAQSADVLNNKALDNLYQEVQTYIQSHNLQANVQVFNQQRGIQITLRDVVLFDSGQAAIKPQAQQLLKGLVPFFQTVTNPIVIEGYTDNVPITTSQYPTNWELSSARAIGVVRYLASIGVDGSRLSGVGYGPYHPVASNDTPAHRQENRRINIVVMRYLSDTEIVTPSTLSAALSGSSASQASGGSENGAGSGTSGGARALASGAAGTAGTASVGVAGGGPEGANGGGAAAAGGPEGATGGGPEGANGSTSGTPTSTVTPINPIAPITPIQPINPIESSASSSSP